MLEAELVVLDGHLRGTNFPLGVRSVIGRALGCDIQLVHDGISRRHCEVTVREDGATVEDLGSTNGTKLNGTRVTSAPLYHGDKLEVGPVILQFACLGARNPQDTGAELAPHMEPTTAQPGESSVALSASRIIPLPDPRALVGDGDERRALEAGHTVLFDLANFLVARRDTVTLASGLLDRVRRAFQPDRAVLFDYDAATDKIRAAQVFRGKDDPPGATVPVPEAVVTKCIRESQVVLAAVDEGGERTLLCSPLRVDLRTLGAIYLDRPLALGPPYSSMDAQALASAAGLAAFAIDRLYFEREARARAYELERQLAGVEADRDALQAAVACALDPLVILDDDGEVRQANAPALALLEAAQAAGAPPLADVVRPLVREARAERVSWGAGTVKLDLIVSSVRRDAGDLGGAVARIERRS